MEVEHRLGFAQANALALPAFTVFAMALNLVLLAVATSVGSYLAWRIWGRDFGYHWNSQRALNHYYGKEHEC